MSNQLMEVTERLETVEKESGKEIGKLNDEISRLKKESQHLKEENRLLRDDNAGKAKNRQKMAGGFRKASGHEMYCRILTIIETLKRRKMGIFENIKLLFMGTPAIF